MTSPRICTPNTFAERQNYSQCNGLDSFFSARQMGSGSPFSMACHTSVIDAFPSVLNEDFVLDGPMALALASRHAATNPDQAALILASAVPPEQLPKSSKLAGVVYDTLFGGGNLPGNISSVTEIALKAAWERQAMNGFKSLTSGTASSVIRLGPHITIEPRNIGKGGDLRKGARMMVRIRGLPMTVVHSLPAPIISKAGGEFGAIRVGARDLARMELAGAAIADARFQSVSALRGASTRFGGGVLAFGPSAVIDMYNSARYENGALSVDWRGFAMKSARSQSGNLIGAAAGSGVAGIAVAFALITPVGWPVVLVGFGVGLAAQVAWGMAGGDDWAEAQLKRAMSK